jgi:tetratricopeptide (TPR) repeat protein
LVSARKFQPWEGGEGQALGQHVRAHIALGRDALRCADAIRQGNRPVQGRVGRARGRLHQRRTGLLRLAAAHFRQALESPPNLGEANHPLANQSEIHYWLGCALGALGDRANARKHWRVAAGFRGGLLNHARKLRKAPATIDYFATSLPAMLLFEEDLERRQETEALLLEAQAHLGLGNRLKARSLLTAVLKRDPNHAVAADFARSCAI